MTENKAKRTLLAALAAVAVPDVAGAQQNPDPLRASASLSSDYMLNGLPQTADVESLRLALDFEHASGFFAGGVAANVDYAAEAAFATPRDTQLVVYAGYVWRSGDWMSNLAVSRYVYPGIDVDYDYTQATVNISFRERYFASASRSNSYLSLYGTAEQLGAGLALPVVANLEFSASAGRFESDGAFDVSYSWWDIGLSRPMGRIALDLRFHDNTYGRSSLLGNDASDLWVLSMTYTFLPIRGQGP